MPDFSLSAANRADQLGPSDYKQRRNLVLIFFGSAKSQELARLLRQITEHHREYEQHEAEVLAISTDKPDRLRQLAQDLAVPFPVLSDEDGRVTDLYLKDKDHVAGKAAFEAAIFIADRWGEIFTRINVESLHDLPEEAEIRGWLEFIEFQCEECFPSEWPK